MLVFYHWLSLYFANTVHSEMQQGAKLAFTEFELRDVNWIQVICLSLRDTISLNVGSLL